MAKDIGPAVTGSILNHVSASQVKTFRACQRKWAFEKLARIRSPDQPWHTRGRDKHAVIEGIYKSPAEPVVDKAVRALIAGGAPVPAAGQLVEQSLTGPDLYITGLYPTRVVGFSDLVLPPVDRTDGRLFKTFPEIWDWKTTSRLANARSPRDLATDVQMLIYAHWALRRWTSAPGVWLCHATVELGDAARISAPRTRISRFLASAARISRGWSGVVETVLAMQQLLADTADAAKPHMCYHRHNMPLDAKSPCAAYGGCPYWTKCFSLSDRLDADQPAQVVAAGQPAAVLAP